MGGSDNSINRRRHSVEDDFPPQLSDDQFYRALSSYHRRCVLSYLLEENETTVDELATVLCGWETTTTGTMQTSTDHSKIYVALVHVHLPKLVDAGLIEYEPNTGSVQINPLHPQVADIIRQSVGVRQSDDS